MERKGNVGEGKGRKGRKGEGDGEGRGKVASWLLGDGHPW